MSLIDLEGRTRSVAELTSNGPVLLAFFKITCPVCQFTFPFLERMRQGAIRFFGVSQDDAESTREFLREYGITFEALLDDEERYLASNAFGISQVPTLVLVGPDQKIQLASAGFSKNDLQELGRRAGVEPFGPRDRVPDYKPG